MRRAVRTNVLPTQKPSLPPGETGKTIEPDKLIVDFRLARQSLEEGHSGIYRYTAKEELDRLFDH